MKRVKRRTITPRRYAFRNAIVKPATDAFLQHSGNVHSTLKAAKIALKKAGGKKYVRVPRIIPIPKHGGFLIPLFAGLSALGALAGGSAQIASAVNAAKAAQKKLEEQTRHDEAMESIALRGKGMNIEIKQRGKTGLGLHLTPKKKLRFV